MDHTFARTLRWIISASEHRCVATRLPCQKKGAVTSLSDFMPSSSIIKYSEVCCTHRHTLRHTKHLYTSLFAWATWWIVRPCRWTSNTRMAACVVLVFLRPLRLWAPRSSNCVINCSLAFVNMTVVLPDRLSKKRSSLSSGCRLLALATSNSVFTINPSSGTWARITRTYVCFSSV